MWKKISDWIKRKSTGKVTLFALAVFLLFSSLVLPSQAERSKQETGSDNSPDLSFYYSPDELYGMAEAYGVDGRQAYIRARFTFDLIWPLIYTIFLSTAISWVYGKAYTSNSLLQLGNLLPIFGAIFDYFENISTSLVLSRYPNHTAGLDIMAPVFTMVKWTCVIGSFVVLVIMILVWSWRIIKRSSIKEML
jgi:hypothetical protein